MLLKDPGTDVPHNDPAVVTQIAREYSPAQLISKLETISLVQNPGVGFSQRLALLVRLADNIGGGYCSGFTFKGYG